MEAQTAKLQALLEQIESGKMETDSARILEYIIRRPLCTIPDMEFSLGMLYRTISARTSQLEDMGIVEKRGTVETKKGTHSTYHYQSEPKKQIANFQERRMKKFRRWVNKCVEFADLAEVRLKQGV